MRHRTRRRTSPPPGTHARTKDTHPPAKPTAAPALLPPAKTHTSPSRAAVMSPAQPGTSDATRPPPASSRAQPQTQSRIIGVRSTAITARRPARRVGDLSLRSVSEKITHRYWHWIYSWLGAHRFRAEDAHGWWTWQLGHDQRVIRQPTPAGSIPEAVDATAHSPCWPRRSAHRRRSARGRARALSHGCPA